MSRPSASREPTVLKFLMLTRYVMLFSCRAGVKGMIVLLPLLGLTWVFGIMAINKDTIAFQYLFAILNSLQVRKFSSV